MGHSERGLLTESCKVARLPWTGTTYTHVSGGERVKDGALRSPDTVVDHREAKQRDEDTARQEESNGETGQRASDQQPSKCCWCCMHACSALCSCVL